ncbi:MAG TPA: glycosyltransferase family 87 protein [Candidatus Tumulicola sp.]
MVLYGLAIFIAGLYQLVMMDLFARNLGDWSAFWSGGATVGTSALTDPKLHCAFQFAHAMSCNVWTYPPGTAFLFWPLAQLPFHVSYVLAMILFATCALIAGVVLADAYVMPRWFGALAAIAWAPIKLAVINGQNETFALLLISLAILSARADRKVLLGLTVGALLYKPTIGLPFAALLLMRREWRASCVVLLCGIFWYWASVIGAGGQWSWPAQYLATLHAFAHGDFIENASRSVGLPDLLMAAGVTMPIAVGIGIALFVVAIPRLLRADLVSSLAIVSLLCVAISPHAWHYAAAVALPAVFYVLRNVENPARTWIVGFAYVVGAVSLINLPGITNWNPEAIVVLGLTVVVLWPGPTTRIWPARAETVAHVPEHQGPS